MKPLLCLILTTTLAFAQGPLTPPAAPAPSMKSLDQIEPRTPIPKSPVVPIAGPHFTISAPGSYYLTGNITVSTGSAIVILADVSDVTLDLNGFTIASTLTGTSLGNAIDMLGTHNRITIRNGNISSGTTVPVTGVAILAGFNGGIDGGFLQHALVSQVHVSGVAGNGIVLYQQGIISECTADNCGDKGLRGETITNSSADRCKYAALSAHNATNCTGASISGIGVVCNGNATNCTGTSIGGIGLFCYGNATNCLGTSNSNSGLYTEGNTTNCTGISTSYHGLTCTSNATNCNGRTTSGTYGMFVTGTASSCRGTNTAGGTALSAAIAIGCTTGGGVVVSPQKHLGTP
jgi:hypothetical protein